MKNTDTSKNSRQITLPDLERRILLDGFCGAPYPAAEYIERNRLANRVKEEEFEKKGELKKSPVRRLILHWIRQGLNVTGVNGTYPEEGFDTGIVDQDELVQFLSEQEYAIPDGFDNDETQQTNNSGAGSANAAENSAKEVTKPNAGLEAAQRALAALALGLYTKYPQYQHGKKPNVKQVSETAVKHLRDRDSQRTPPGFGQTNIRDAISAALIAHFDLKE